MNAPYGYLVFLADFRQHVQEVGHGERLASACFAPQCEVDGMITLEQTSEMAAELLYFRIA